MSLKRQAVSGVKWSFFQQFSVQIINFAVQVMLARLLMPEMFGLIAMIMVFISIGKSLVDSGMTSSLVRTTTPSQLDYSTVFLANMAISILIYTFTYLLAPYIASFYDQAILTDIIRLFALSFIINAFTAVHIAKLTKEMNFKLQMKLQLPSTIISGFIGIILAYNDYGVWSLVWLNIIRSVLFTLQCWCFIDWRPSLIFDKENFKYHFNFGYKLTLSSLIDTIYNDSYRVIIGKYFSPVSVGLYNHAENMRLFPVSQISSVVNRVTYPFFSNIANDNELKNAYRLTLKLVLLAVVPVMLALILIAEEGFRFLFGKQWLPSVIYFQILALASIVRPISSYNLNILKVKGRSDLFLKLEIIKKLLAIVFIFIGFQFNVIGLVISSTIFFYITVIIDMSYSGKLISYGIFEQLRDISHFFVIGCLVFSFLYIIKEQFASLLKYDLLISSVFSLVFILLYIITVLKFDKKLLNTLISLKNHI